jgi:hypothetical protein
VSEALLRPRWGGGWAAARVLFALAMAVNQLRRAAHVQDALMHPQIVFAAGGGRVADHVLLAPAVAWALWGAGLVALGMLARGGRCARPGLVIWALAYAALVLGCGLNVRVPERMMFWATIGLWLGPVDQPLDCRASPVARLYLLVVLGSLYLSTGLMKLLEEPAWWDGTALRYDLVDRFHAGGALAVWLSASPGLACAASWYTVIFEVGFVFLVGWPRLNPWVLGAGVLMHAGIAALMDVGALGMSVVALYPVVLDPETAERWWRRWRG